MAEVLQVPRPDTSTFYQASGLRRSRPSSTSLYQGSPALSSSPNAPPSPPSSTSSSPPETSYIEQVERASPPPPPSFSTPSPAPSIASFDTSGFAQDSSGLSLEQRLSRDDDFSFPDYGGVQFFHVDQDLVTPRSSDVQFFHTDEELDTSQSSDDAVESATTDTTRSDSPLPTPTVADDTAIRQAPSRHVDYLSHDWREEDIWSSWRHIVSQRKVYGQRSRLENASWRTWAKSKYQLRTVSPETLNWLKESDVTWLYGPLKSAESHPVTSSDEPPLSQLSSGEAFVHKKPILKKRSMSEVMLQRSISTSSLLKQAAESAQAQQSRSLKKSAFKNSSSDNIASSGSSETPSRDQLDYCTSWSSSGQETPVYEGVEKRHIRFNDEVEQCIAVDVKDTDFDYDDSEADRLGHGGDDDDSSDEGVVMMKRMKRRPNMPTPRKAAVRTISQTRCKTIESLPATTLKDRAESPNIVPVTPHPQKHTFGHDWKSSKMSPSPSQETLRPSHPSTNFLIPDEDEGGEVDTSSSWSFGASNPKSSLGASADPLAESSTRRRDSMAVYRGRAGAPAPLDDGDTGVEGMRRTNSGMYMPYDEDEEDDIMAASLFGKVSETLNTAKDIAHVIWNVGWRK